MFKKMSMIMSLLVLLFCSTEAKFTLDDLEMNFSQEELFCIVPSYNKLLDFVDSLNTHNVNEAFLVIAPDNIDLRKKVKNMIMQRTFLYWLDIYPIEDNGIVCIDSDTIKLTGNCKIQEVFSLGTFTLEAFSNYFVFKRVGDDWLLVDTDLCEKLDLKMIYLCIVGLIFIFAFWIWMIVDCVHRDFNRRGRWLLLLLLLNIIGGVIYFVCVKLRRWNNKAKISE